MAIAGARESSQSARLLERRFRASWGDDIFIVFATDDTGAPLLWRLSANGGPPTILTRPDAAQLGPSCVPSVLAGVQHVLFTIAAGRADSAQESPFST